MKEPAQIPILFFLIKKYINSVYKLIVHEGFIMEGKGTINKKLKEKALIGVLLLLSAIPISLANQPQPSDPISTDAFQNTNHENHFYTGPAKTILDSPNGLIDAGTPTYKWYSVEGTTFYCLKVNDSSGKTVVNQCYKAEDLSAVGLLSVTPAVNLRPGDYKWCIQTWNCSGSNSSDEMLFTICTSPPGSVSPISPQGLIFNSTPTYIWTALPTATKYLLQIENKNHIIFEKTYLAEEVTVGNQCNVFSPVTLPLDYSEFFWRVQASNEAGSGPMSNYIWFEPVCGGSSKKDLAKAKREHKLTKGGLSRLYAFS
jgi:hypothetical protein